MPKFSQSSQIQLATCHPELQVLFNKVIQFFDCQVLEGFRGEQDQNKAYQEGSSKLRWPNGKHNRMPSDAVDVSPYPVIWNNLARFYWFSGYVLATARSLKEQAKMTRDIRYGGDWNRNYDITDEKGLRDLVHFELV